MMRSKIFFISVLVGVSLVLTGCIRINGPQAVGVGGGIFKSVDGGENWSQEIQLLRLPEEKNILAGAQTTVMTFDPQDSGTVYLGTQENGAFVSFDGADTWERIRNLEKGNVNAIVVHPLAKHIVYIAVDNQILKTIDANRTWDLIYVDGIDEEQISALTVNPADPQTIYAGLSDGRLIISEDGGLSWRALYDTKDSVNQIVIYPLDNQRVYMVSSNQGIYRSNDKGENWQLVNNGLQGVKKIVFDRNNEETIIALTDIGLYRSINGGESWEEYTLLIPGPRLKVYSIGLDPQDSNIIYYTTLTTLYKSIDNGQHWITRPMPFKARLKELLIDPINPHILYIGAGQ